MWHLHLRFTNCKWKWSFSISYLYQWVGTICFLKIPTLGRPRLHLGVLFQIYGYRRLLRIFLWLWDSFGTLPDCRWRGRTRCSGWSGRTRRSLSSDRSWNSPVDDLKIGSFGKKVAFSVFSCCLKRQPLNHHFCQELY